MAAEIAAGVSQSETKPGVNPEKLAQRLGDVAIVSGEQIKSFHRFYNPQLAKLAMLTAMILSSTGIVYRGAEAAIARGDDCMGIGAVPAFGDLFTRTQLNFKGFMQNWSIFTKGECHVSPQLISSVFDGYGATQGPISVVGLPVDNQRTVPCDYSERALFGSVKHAFVCTVPEEDLPKGLDYRTLANGDQFTIVWASLVTPDGLAQNLNMKPVVSENQTNSTPRVDNLGDSSTSPANDLGGMGGNYH